MDSVRVSLCTLAIGTSSQGKAYVFAKNGTTWTQQQEPIASDGAANDTFGVSVPLSVDARTAAVGAHKATGGGNPGQEAAYVFAAKRHSDCGDFQPQQALTTDASGNFDTMAHPKRRSRSKAPDIAGKKLDD